VFFWHFFGFIFASQDTFEELAKVCGIAANSKHWPRVVHIPRLQALVCLVYAAYV